MNRIVLIIIFFTCMECNIHSQSLWDSVIKVKNLIDEDKDDEAETILDRIEKQCLNSDKDSIIVLFYESRGAILWDREKYKECIPYFHKAIDLYEKLNIKAQNYLDAFVAIGYSYGRLNDYDNAEKYYRKALLKSVAAEYAKEFRHNVYKNLGNIYMAKGDSILAKECYKRVGAEDVEDLDFMNTNFLQWESAYWDRIMHLVNEKKYEEAANEYIDFINSIKEKRGCKDEVYILAVYSRGILLSRYLQRLNEAIPLFKELTDMSAILPKPNKNICGAFCNLALCYSRIDDYVDLEKIIQNGIEYLQKANIKEYPPHMIYRFAGNGAYWQQEYARAITYYEKYVYSKDEHEGGTCYEEIANQLSVSYLFTDLPEKAKSTLLNLLDESEGKLRKENSSLLANIYHNLGRAYMLENDKVKALKYLNKSSKIQKHTYGSVLDRTTQYINECQTR